MHSHYSHFLSSIKYRCQLYIMVGTKIEGVNFETMQLQMTMLHPFQQRAYHEQRHPGLP